MKMREFYENSGVDYDALLARLLNKEALVEKYMKLFLSDPTFSELQAAVEAKDYKNVEIKAHTLKGMSLNLDLKKLSSICMEMLLSVRSEKTEMLSAQLEELKTEHMRIVSQLADET